MLNALFGSKPRAAQEACDRRLGPGTEFRIEYKLFKSSFQNARMRRHCYSVF